MYFSEWNSLVDAVYVLSDQRRYNEGLELLTEGLVHLPAKEHQDNYFSVMHTRASMLSRCHHFEDCLDVIAELVDQELVCGDFLFERMESIASGSRFTALQEKNRALRQRLQAHSESVYEVHLPEGYSHAQMYPLFIILHGDGSSTANLRK